MADRKPVFLTSLAKTPGGRCLFTELPRFLHTFSRFGR